MFIKSKKSQASTGGTEVTLFFLGEIIAATLIIFLMVSQAEVYAKGEAANKIFLAKDMFLTINALQSIENNFVLNYQPRNTSDFLFRIKDQKITIASDSFLNPTNPEFSFVDKSANKIDIELTNPEQISIIKTGDIVEIKAQEITTQEIPCQETKNKDPNWLQNKKVIVDYTQETNIIAQYLKAKIKNTRLTELTQEQSDKISMLSRENPDILLIISFNKDSSDIIIHTSSNSNIPNENQILICNLIKSFNQNKQQLQFNNIISTSIETNPLLNIAKDQLAVEINLNNINNPNLIGDTIKNALQNYYK